MFELHAGDSSPSSVLKPNGVTRARATRAATHPDAAPVATAVELAPGQRRRACQTCSVAPTLPSCPFAVAGAPWRRAPSIRPRRLALVSHSRRLALVSHSGDSPTRLARRRPSSRHMRASRHLTVSPPRPCSPARRDHARSNARPAARRETYSSQRRRTPRCSIAPADSLHAASDVAHVGARDQEHVPSVALASPCQKRAVRGTARAVASTERRAARGTQRWVSEHA
jgi:hypothetical protein